MMELFEYPDLGSVMEMVGDTSEQNISSRVSRAMKVFIQVLLGLNFLHQHSLLHRNLRLENILVDDDDSIKLVNFEQSTSFDMSTPNNSPPLHHLTMSFQILPISGACGRGGVRFVLRYVFGRRAAVRTLHAQKTVRRSRPAQLIVNGSYEPIPPSCPSKIQSIIQALLSLNPKNRPSSDLLLQDLFVREHTNTLELLADFPAGRYVPEDDDGVDMDMDDGFGSCANPINGGGGVSSGGGAGRGDDVAGGVADGEKYDEDEYEEL